MKVHSCQLSTGSKNRRHKLKEQQFRVEVPEVGRSAWSGRGLGYLDVWSLGFGFQLRFHANALSNELFN